ncbi:hypothetical protein R6Q57_001163 [Mikania cordata]
MTRGWVLEANVGPLPAYGSLRDDVSSSDEMEVVGDDMGQPHVDDLDVEHFDELMDHPWLQFPHVTIARQRRDRLLKKEMGNQKAIDYDLLAELGQQERMTVIIGEDTPLSCLFEMTYRPQALDFQSQPGQPQQAEVSFRLCGFPYHLSLAEFGSVLGLYTKEETQMPIYTTAIHTADDTVVSAWWPRIGDEGFVAAPGSRVFVTCSLGICTGALSRLLQDVA